MALRLKGRTNWPVTLGKLAIFNLRGAFSCRDSWTRTNTNRIQADHAALTPYPEVGNKLVTANAVTSEGRPGWIRTSMGPGYPFNSLSERGDTGLESGRGGNRTPVQKGLAYVGLFSFSLGCLPILNPLDLTVE